MFQRPSLMEARISDLFHNRLPIGNVTNLISDLQIVNIYFFFIKCYNLLIAKTIDFETIYQGFCCGFSDPTAFQNEPNFDKTKYNQCQY